jgi:hypothetical protein
MRHPAQSQQGAQLAKNGLIHRAELIRKVAVWPVMVATDTLRDDKCVQLNDFWENDAVAGRSYCAPIHTRFGRLIHFCLWPAPSRGIPHPSRKNE